MANLNRIIKFRAWSKKKKKMFRVDMLNLKLKTAVSLDTKTYPPDWSWKWKDLELMQFTGLLDRHGKEIYEGDILEEVEKCPYCKQSKKGNIKQVYWCEAGKKKDGVFGGFFGVLDKNGNSYTISNLADDFKVIGNIYENKSLLEDSK